MLKQYKIENTDTTFLRIWQKVIFGKEVFKPEIFIIEPVKDTDYSKRLKVCQIDNDTRGFYLDNIFYIVDTKEPIYNFLDTGRALNCRLRDRYGDTRGRDIYIFNDLLIPEDKVKDFEDFRKKEDLGLKKLYEESDIIKVFLVFNEDFLKIESEVTRHRAEEKAEQLERTKAEAMDLEVKKNREIAIRDIFKTGQIEDEDTIIKDNYIIDKVAGFKIVFNDKIVKIFTSDDMFRSYNRYNDGFIEMDFNTIFEKLQRIYNIGKYEEPLENKLKEANKNLFNFKIYSYDIETKTEVFLTEIKIKNIIKEELGEEDKLRFMINGVKIPKQKISRAFYYLKGGYGINRETRINRFTNLDNELEAIKLFSGKQLELLAGKTIDIKVNDTNIPLHFEIKYKDKETWIIKFGDYSMEREYSKVKEAFQYLCGGNLTAISRICHTLQAGQELEDLVIAELKIFLEKRRIAEARAESLFIEFIARNKTRVFKKDDGYIVKGKLKNYKVAIKDDGEAGVWTYPENNYVCINEKTKAGRELCRWDKLLQFSIAMLNDSQLKQEIHTIH